MPRRMIAAVVLLTMIVAGPRLTAQIQPRPTVTVVPFDVGRARVESAEDGAVLADDLAKLLVDSGRFRVLDRAWLPVPKLRESRPTVLVLRQAATSASVRYLVLGTVRQTVQRVVVPQAVGFPAPQGRVPMPMPARVIGRVTQTGQGAYGQRTQEVASCWIEIQVIDTETGELIRRLSARSNATAHAAVTDLAEGLSRLSPQLVAEGQ